MHWIEAACTAKSESSAHWGLLTHAPVWISTPRQVCCGCPGILALSGAAHRAPLLLSLSIFIFILAERAPAGDGQGELRAHYTCCLASCSWARLRNFAESWAKPTPPGPATPSG